MSAPGYDWAAIKATVNIVEIVGRSVKLTRAGNLYKGCCPFHNERSASFTVYTDHAHCFGCGWHGDALDFVAANEGCDVNEAIKRIGAGELKTTPQLERAMTQRAAEQQEQREQAIATARARWEAATVDGVETHGYLAHKGVPPHMARVDGRALLLPVYDKAGDVQSVQAISPTGDKLFHAHAPMKGGRLYFGINLGRSIICEGFATGASIYEALAERVVVGFSGAGVADMARELHGQGLDIAIAADRKGLAAMIALGTELGVPVFVPPAPYDDFNDLENGTGDLDGEGPAAIRAVFAAPIGAHEAPPAAHPTVADNEDGDAPVDIWARHLPPALPEGLLPPIIERFARIRAQMIGGDPGGLAMSALSVLSAALTDRIQVKVKRHENWQESARLWVMLIGDPSYKKSPIMRAAAGKLSSLDGQMLRDYNRAFTDWKEAGEHGEMPQCRRLRIEDTTMEAAQEVCASSPDGIMALQDELSGWFGGIEKYSGGKGGAKDRSFWLRAYGGGEYAVNRISRKSILIDNLSISILGGIQPDAIRRVMADSTDDGLIQRFMPVVLAPAGTGTDEDLPDVAREYDALVERMVAMVPPSNFFGEHPLRFDAAAMDIRADLERKHHGMVTSMEGVNKKLASHLGKYDGLFPRLCVVWHCIENANADSLPEVIEGATARRVADFLHRYVMRHALAFYASTIGLSEDQDIIADIAGYILAHGLEVITMRTFQRGSTRMRKLTRFQVEPICQQLEAFGWVNGSGNNGDRFPFRVNPAVHMLFTERAAQEKDRRDGVVSMIRQIVND